jgi:hypothetical protein
MSLRINTTARTGYLFALFNAVRVVMLGKGRLSSFDGNNCVVSSGVSASACCP